MILNIHKEANLFLYFFVCLFCQFVFVLIYFVFASFFYCLIIYLPIFLFFYFFLISLCNIISV